VLWAMTRAFERAQLTPPPGAQVRRLVGLSLPVAIRELAPEAEPALQRDLTEFYKSSFRARREEGLLAENDNFDGVNSQVTIDVTAGATYFILAVPVSTSQTGSYTVSVNVLSDDHPDFGEWDDATEIALDARTGIGSAVFLDGELMPNTEFGHLVVPHGKHSFEKAEHLAADSARKRDDLSWGEWADRFNDVLDYYYSVTWPDHIIVGGGVAKKGEKFLEYLRPPCAVSLAKLQNRAGIIGAALAAESRLGQD